MRLKLYFAPGLCAFASLIALEEAGATYEAQPVMLAAGEQRRPEFLALSPRGQVPVMDADGELIRENLAVLSFIAYRFPDAKLLPFGDPVATVECKPAYSQALRATSSRIGAKNGRPERPAPLCTLMTWAATVPPPSRYGNATAGIEFGKHGVAYWTTDCIVRSTECAVSNKISATSNSRRGPSRARMAETVIATAGRPFGVLAHVEIDFVPCTKPNSRRLYPSPLRGT